MPKKLIEGLPDFLVIGAGKSGTTWIYKYLHQHPEVFGGVGVSAEEADCLQHGARDHAAECGAGD